MDPFHGSLARPSRDAPPAHYTLKIDSFSQLVQDLYDTGAENYESEIFEASGYQWKLTLYPNGDREQDGEGHISMYLVIAETKSLPVGWEVKVNLRLFVLDKLHDTYAIFQDDNGRIRYFNEYKRESGFSKLLPLGVFHDPSNGFLIRDKCMFGVEVFVLNYSGRGECVKSLQEVEATHTWRIENFSSLQIERHCSDKFTLGNRTWHIVIYPKGVWRSKGKELSLFLELGDFKMKGKAYVDFKLRVRDQLHGNHKEIPGKGLMTQLGLGWNFIALSDLNNASKGFLIDDTLIVEVEIISISGVKTFPAGIAVDTFGERSIHVCTS